MPALAPEDSPWEDLCSGSELDVVEAGLLAVDDTDGPIDVACVLDDCIGVLTEVVETGRAEVGSVDVGIEVGAEVGLDAVVAAGVVAAAYW